MKGLANLSPLQLASLAFGSSLISSTLFILPIAPGSYLRFEWIALGIAFLAAGIYLVFKAKTELESGIANQRWPEAQVERLRSIVNSPTVTIVFVAFMLAYVSMVFQHNSFRHIAWGFYWPAQAITQLRFACKEPKPQGPFERLDWKTIPPLQSEHWGER
jgi:hypothetical protein